MFIGAMSPQGEVSTSARINSSGKAWRLSLNRKLILCAGIAILG
jgi:hypothetical protein